MCKFEKKGLKKILDDLKSKNWLNNFDEKEKEDFIKKVCELEFTSPKKDDVFKALELFEPSNTNILIIGQDPYPSKGNNAGRAHGLAFSFGPNATKKEADDSLLNIFKAIENYKSNKIKTTPIDGWNTNLEKWASTNKVLLLNTALTYKEGQKTKHQEVWKPFVKKIISNLLTNNPGKLVVFLWGEDARKLFHESIYNEQNKQNIHDIIKGIERNLLVLTTSHPTENHNAYKKGFCYETPNHFKACDKFLFENDEKKYIWKNFPEA